MPVLIPHPLPLHGSVRADSCSRGSKALADSPSLVSNARLSGNGQQLHTWLAPSVKSWLGLACANRAQSQSRLRADRAQLDGAQTGAGCGGSECWCWHCKGVQPVAQCRPVTAQTAFFQVIKSGYTSQQAALLYNIPTQSGAWRHLGQVHPVCRDRRACLKLGIGVCKPYSVHEPPGPATRNE